MRRRRLQTTRLAVERNRPIYRPLVETLGVPMIRILRAMATHDWVETEEINLLLDVHHDAHLRDAYNQTTCVLHRRGLIDRRRVPIWIVGSSPYEHRINESGRAFLAAALDRARPERELGELSDAEAALA